jgi:hypothetical protein
MPADRSRRTDGLRDAYVGVVTQQGRVTLDRDFNAEHGYLAGRLEAETIDVIGPCGTADDGFKISLPGSGAPPLWVPPQPLATPSPEPEFDFLISAGTMYLGGHRAVLPGIQGGQTIGYSFFDQPDLAHAPDGPTAVGPNNPPKQELVYLALAEREVSAVEDPDLLEAALGGPDTTQRLRLMRRVSRVAVTATDCTTGWEDGQQKWLANDGLTLDPATMALQPSARLQVSFADEGATTDPCDPLTVNGYLGAENQTIRVQIAESGGVGASGASTEASLLWGYDNAGFLYRATPLASNPAMLTISPTPPDSFHIPQTNQVVEILRTAAVIASEPDMTDPAGQATIVRCVAEATGFVARLTQPYGPTDGGDPTAYIVLDQPLPAEFLADTTPLFLRVWQSQIAFGAGGGTVLLTDDVTGASTGVQVTLSTPAGEPLLPGAYWEIAVRPSTPQAVYPERLLTGPQPPDGPSLWSCPLAVIDWTSDPPTVTDCRSTFTGLVGQGRGSGCCTVSVTPTGKLGVQQAIDLAGKAGGGTVCLAGGIYPQTTPIVFGPAHSGVTLEACQSATLSVEPGSEAAFSDGLIQIVNAPKVTLSGLSLAPALAPRPTAVTNQINGLLAGPAFDATALATTGASIEVIVAIRVVESANVTVEDCLIVFINRKDAPLTIFGAGLIAQGDCQGLTVEGCTFESSIIPTFTRFTPAPTPTAGGIAAPVIPPNFVTGAVAATVAAGTAPTSAGRAARSSRAPKAAAATSTVVAAPPAPLPPPASPPPAPSGPLFSDPIIELAHTSFQTIAFNTLSTNAVITQRHLVAIVGCLAGPTLQTDSKSSLPCNLGEARVRRNRFVNLTLGFFGVAGVQTLRLDDNDATACRGGLWLGFPGWRTPTDPKAQPLFQQWTSASSFTELSVISAIGFSFPPPSGAAAMPSTGPSTVFVTGNQVEPPAVAGASTAALVILANLAPVQGADTSVSMVVANNRLRSWSVTQTPAAFVSTGAPDRCAITGNLILSEPTPGTDSGASLWLVPDPISGAAPMVTATGNVLQGRTTLQEISRAGDSQPEVWANLNAQSF